MTGLTNGTTYHFTVTATNIAGTSAPSGSSNSVTPSPAANIGTAPSAPIIRNAASGAVGGAVTATANWRIPANNGGSPITQYKVTAVASVGGAQTTATTTPVAGRDQTLSMTLTAGTYRFFVVAVNVNGDSPASGLSNQVTAR